MPSPLQTIIRDLQRPRGRQRRGLTLAEGIRLVEEALVTGRSVEAALYSPGLRKTPRGADLLESLVQAGVKTERVADRELESLAETQHPQGIIAVVRPPSWVRQDFRLEQCPLLVLDGVQDPGNVGSILRTAFALGAAGVVALPGTVELTNPKVVRGSMGAFFRLPTLELTVAQFLEWAGEASLTVLAADMQGEPIRDLSVQGRIAVVLGNEGAGLTTEIRQAGRPVAIPLAAGAESLNVAVAAAILLYEVMRER